MGFISCTTARRLGCLAAAALTKVGAESLPAEGSFRYVGPKNCSTVDATIVGYDNITTMTIDMLLMSISVTEGSMDRDDVPGVYTLCPHKTFRLGRELPTGGNQEMMPFVPVFEDTVFQCGKDGRLEDECVVEGGYRQVVFDDDLHRLQNITFRGIHFEKSENVAVWAIGHPTTDLEFDDCEFKYHKGKFVIATAWDKDMKIFLERRSLQRFLDELSGDGGTTVLQLKTWRGMLSTGQNRRTQLEEIGEGAMHTKFTKCKFTDNDVSIAAIANEGGRLELNQCAFERNKKPLAVVLSYMKSALSIYGGTRFVNNEDQIGPVFMDWSSRLDRFDDDTEGEGNVALSECQGIFIEDEGRTGNESCLSDDDAVCKGTCCEFGDTRCVESALTAPLWGSSPDKCGALCVSMAIFVPLVVIVVILLLWSACRTRGQVAAMNRTAGEGGRGCELEGVPKEGGVPAPHQAFGSEEQAATGSESYFA